MYGTLREQLESDIKMEKKAIEDLEYKIAVKPWLAGWWFDARDESKKRLEGLQYRLSQLPFDQP